jgi:alpha-beta hydrolase superfamily lysophospholipase
MGGLTVSSFLANNPDLKVAGAVFSAPLMQMSKLAGINNFKRILVSLMVPVMDNIVLNPMIPLH